MSESTEAGKAGQSVRILAFAGARDVVGSDRFEIALDGACSTAELLDRICARYPALGPRRACLRLAVNGVYVKPGARIAPGDEVALIPPVAGG